VFLAVYKDAVSWLKGVVGIVGLAVALGLAIRWYKRLRTGTSQ
jgi:hypothetical protein